MKTLPEVYRKKKTPNQQYLNLWTFACKQQNNHLVHFHKTTKPKPIEISSTAQSKSYSHSILAPNEAQSVKTSLFPNSMLVHKKYGLYPIFSSFKEVMNWTGVRNLYYELTFCWLESRPWSTRLYIFLPCLSLSTVTHCSLGLSLALPLITAISTTRPSFLVNHPIINCN